MALSGVALAKHRGSDVQPWEWSRRRWQGHSANETGGTSEILSGQIELVEPAESGGMGPSCWLATVRPIRLSQSTRPASSRESPMSLGRLGVRVLQVATGESGRLGSSGSHNAKVARPRRPPRAQIAMFGAGVGVRCLPRARHIAAAVVPVTQGFLPRRRQSLRHTPMPLGSLLASRDQAERRLRRFLSNRRPGTVSPWPTAEGIARPRPDARAARISRRTGPRQTEPAQGP